MSAETSFGINVRELTHLSLERDPARLEAEGGVTALAEKLHVDFDVGILPDSLDLRREAFGANIYPEAPSKSFLALLVDAFGDLTLQILTGLAVVSLILELALGGAQSGGWIEPVAIMIAVVIVAFVGAGNNYSKEQQFRQLNKKKEERLVKVLRGGQRLVVSIFDICVGDVCIVESGDQVPADGVFIDGFNVATDESSMTGETDMVKKTTERPFLLSGTQVTEGTGRMLVLAVGENSEWGMAIVKLTKPAEDTPLQEKLDEMANQIGKGGLAIAVLTFAVLAISYTVRTSDNNAWDSTAAESFVNFFLIAVTIVVVAVPEGLPLAVTIALAYSMKKMMKDNNLVRHLSACETMGGATTICSDKTGTLTENRMTVVQGYFCTTFHEDVPTSLHDEKAQHLLCEGIAVNSKAVVGVGEDGRPDFVGNKTECALLYMCQQSFGFDWDASRKQFKNAFRQVYTFSSDRKRMSSVVKMPDGSFRLYCKGASEIVSGLCTHALTGKGNGESAPISEAQRASLDEMIVKMASAGLRTICLAYRDLGFEDRGAEWDDLSHTPEREMTQIAIVGIKDPLRKEVYDAVARCKASGIMVRMVTGDNVLTAKHIATECGILFGDGIAIEGREFRNMTDEQKDKILPRLQVMARSTPSDKFILVSRLRALGEVVAVTGDGTNDAPALKEADVGLSMGLSGTEVAKEASDIVILDDNFSSIVKAVLWGRSVYENIRKFLQFQLTVNFVALTIVFISALAQRDLPLTSVQLLWVNLIMDTFAALALATEQPSPSLLERKPYGRYEPLITSVMIRNIVGQGLFQITFLLTMLFAGPAIFGVPENSIRLGTIIFNAFVFCQLFNEINSRCVSVTDGWNANIFRGLSIREAPLFFIIWVFTACIQALLVSVGGSATQTAPLSGTDWLICIVIAFISFPVGVILRAIHVPPRKHAVPDDVKAARERAEVEDSTSSNGGDAMSTTRFVSSDGKMVEMEERGATGDAGNVAADDHRGAATSRSRSASKMRVGQAIVEDPVEGERLVDGDEV